MHHLSPVACARERISLSPITSHNDALDSVALYREILASAEPRSSTIVGIGTMHDLSALLESDLCKFSELNGKDLVENSFLQVVATGGNLIDGKGRDRRNRSGADALCDYNEWSCQNKERTAVCHFVFENCKAPFVASIGKSAAVTTTMLSGALS